MRLDVLTLFPEMFAPVLGSSILKRAAESITDPATGAVRPPVAEYHVANLRDFTTDKHQKVDQPPFGGGPGMVIQCQPVWDAVRAVEARDDRPATRVVMSPQGRPLTQSIVESLARRPRLLILAGHYEGFDERVLDALRDDGGLEEISIGDYVLSGGELPAMVLIDAVVRLIPGALGTQASAEHESFSADLGGLLDYPHYTRPRTWLERDTPDVLLSGDHAKIEQWRLEQARQRTAERRPDLLGRPTGAGDRPALVVIRPERPEDVEAVDQVHRDAFPGPGEAALVRKLRQRREAVVALVAEAAGEVVGHVVLSPVTLAEQASVRGMVGLGPIGVRPAWQGRGVGTALTREALTAAARDLAARAVFVLGEPAYYKRFGFEQAKQHGFSSDYGDGPEFMVALPRGPLPETWTGRVQYAAPFAELPG